MDGTLGNEKAPLQNGRECDYGPYYQHSISLQSLNVTPSPMLTSILVRKVRIRQGTLLIVEMTRTNVKNYENYFNATVLEKVNPERCGEERYHVDDEFYQAPYCKEKLGIDLLVPRSLNLYKPLKQTGIFGAVGASQFPYHFDTNVWRAFCELWGPLTNILHYGEGEVDISLYDLDQIGGLPIPGAIYEEFLPPNKDLTGRNKYLATVAELLRIHAKLYEFHKVKHIYYDLLLDHFYREYLKEKIEVKERSPICISSQERITKLNVTAEGELAAFLAIWLSRFVLSHGKEVIRPETFVIAALMAYGQSISLAPSVMGCIYHGLVKAISHPDNLGKANVIFPSHDVIVLGYIYHGLVEAISHPNNPSQANVIFPSHDVIGWLAEIFPYLYCHRPIAIVPVTFLHLFIMPGCLVANFLYPRLDMSSGIGDIFPLDLAHIVRTLVTVGM
ncbi:hypothetical protein Cgig2_010664 [Carnegiea gigantea]|uniref:Aminotransferase-like plant mobile domain-containing protein n=1 Tax=Carnegiea gigantea TaxID=171969 RepID=A0A9Q1GYF2_9CARY|nr:hypothetical protein Cgig2_010664 [Carnegiea gigantea]